MPELSNSLKNWKKPIKTTEIPTKEAENINELLLESKELEKTLNPELVKLWKDSLKNVVLEINLLRESIGLKIIEAPNILFIHDSNKRYKANVETLYKYEDNTDWVVGIGHSVDVNLYYFELSSEIRAINHLLAHEMTHFSDSYRIFSFQDKMRKFSGVDFDQLTNKTYQHWQYLKEKITLSAEEMQETKNYLTSIGANLENKKNKTLWELILTKRQEIGKEKAKDKEDNLSPEALKFLNHFMSINPDKSGFEVWNYLEYFDFYAEKIEDEKVTYLLPGLLDKANQKNWLNEGLCDFLGNLIADKILGKVTLEEEKNKEVGYPEYFLKIQNFWNSCDENQQKEFLNAVLLAKFKYNSIAPIYKFFQKFFANSQDLNFPKRFSIRDIFHLNIFETAKNYNCQTKE